MKSQDKGESFGAFDDITPAVIAPLDAAARVLLQMSPRLVAVPVRGDIILRAAPDQGYRTDARTAAEILAAGHVIAHNAKALCAELLAATDVPIGGADVKLPEIEFDTRLAAFLLNSLRKAPTLGEAAGIDLDEDDGRLSVAAIWMLYNSQHEKLASLSKLNKLAREVDFPLQALLAIIERHGVRLDTAGLKQMSGDLAARIKVIEQAIYDLVGYEFNVSSAPQLSDALFRKLQLPSDGIKRSVRGYFSTSQKELDKLRGQHPIIEKVEQVRELLKLKNTYVDALPKLVDADSYLHTSLNQDITATGRLSSSNPNLQNIPIRTPLGQEIRKSFIASSGKILISADYSQFELRLAAALAHDTNLIEDFQNDAVDIHTKTAAEAYGVALEDVTPVQRRHAKTINFGVLYGMSPHGLAAATGMSFTEAKAFIDRYFKVRAPIRNFIDATIEQAKTAGYVETLFGRRRPTPDVKSANFVVREAAKRAAANMPIQGTEADLMKMAMLQIARELAGRADQILQIHDSIMVECDPAAADDIGAAMKQIMENIYPALGVRFKVDIKSGANWGEL
jgi:DNA polymerase-1